MNFTTAKKATIDTLSNGITTLTPLLTGGAGVGKTQLVRQLCDELGLSLAYVNLADRQPGEFAINYVAPDGSLGCVIDSVFDADIVFFDELNRAQLIMSEIMNIMQSKTLRGHRLGCQFICAMNTGGAYDVSDLDPAQWGRFVPIPLAPSMDEWSRYITTKHARSPVTTASVLAYIRKTNGLYGGANDTSDLVNPRVWDELLTLGVKDFAPLLLPPIVAEELAHELEAATYPDYADASATNWVPRHGEFDYILGALNEPLPTVVRLMTCLSVDSLGLVLTEIATRKPRLHGELFNDETFCAYVEKVG